MAAGDIYRKSALGTAEIGARKMRLNPRLRTMLILIDGATGPAASPPGAPAAPPGEFERFRAAKDFMNVTVVDALGIKSFFFTLKLEKAGNRADLRDLAPAYREAIAKAEGDAQADVLAGRRAEMLR